MHAIVPIKNLSDAKERLSTLLDKSHRQGLFRAMSFDVLSVLKKQPGISGIVIVSDDPVAARLAEDHGTELLTENELNVTGLNSVIQAAVSHMALRQIQDVMIIHADVPLINAVNLSQLITMHQKIKGPRLTIAPDRHHNGSNCIICSPASSFTFQYGADSFNKHCAQADALRFEIQVLDDPDIGCDIDYPQDLAHFLERSKGRSATRTGKYLSKNGITHAFIKNTYDQSTLQDRQYEWVS